MAFCPKCKSEYREGIVECADCHIQLVDKLENGVRFEDKEIVPSRVDVASLPFVTVFVSDSQEEAGMVEILLSEQKIPFITRGKKETKGKYVDFLVREDKAMEAKEALKHIIEDESAGISQTLPDLEEPQEEEDPLKEWPVLPPQGAHNAPAGGKTTSGSFYVFAFICLAVIIGAAVIPGIAKNIRFAVILILMLVLAISSFTKDKKV